MSFTRCPTCGETLHDVDLGARARLKLVGDLLRQAFRWAESKEHPLSEAPKWYREARTYYPDIVLAADPKDPT